MAEIQSKRQREEESHEPEGALELKDSTSKRHKSYSNECSILDEEPEENEPNQGLSDIFSTLQQELSTTAAATSELDPLLCTASEAEQDNHPAATTTLSGGGECNPKEEDDSIKVIRHLLEASDDELGIPNANNRVDEEINSGNYNAFEASSFDGFWELEDEAANYYTVLQSELFM